MDAQAYTLMVSANSYSASGQPHRAVPLIEMHNTIRENAGDKKNLAVGLVAVADEVFLIGALSSAERNMRHQINLCVEINEKFHESYGHLALSRVLAYCGSWNKSGQEQDIAQQILENKNHLQGQCIVWSYRALRFLLMAREAVGSNQSQIENLKSSIECAQRALELADEQAKKYSVPRDYVRAHWLLGAAYCMNNELTLAEENLSKALNLCRQINLVDTEANILLDIARLSFAYGLSSSAQDRLAHFKDAKEKADEALNITERCGYVLQGADVNNFLAEYTLGEIREKRVESSKGLEMARKYAEEAKRLATCDGPPYYYKVAYEEAERMLERLKV